MALRRPTIKSILRLLPVFLLQLGIHPASAETATQRCAEIGRALSADLGRVRTMVVPDSSLLGALLDPARNDALEALGGFEAPEYYSGLLELEEHLGPSTIQREVVQHPPLTDGSSLDAYDLRTRADRVVVVKPAEKPACASITTLARDRSSQRISLSTPTLTCEAQSAHVIRLAKGGTFVAMLDLPRKQLAEIAPLAEHSYGLKLFGVGAADEQTICRYRLDTDAAARLEVERASAVNDMLAAALFGVGPATPQQQAIKDWLNQHGRDIATAYVDKMSGRSVALSWPPDVVPESVVLADAPLDLSKDACGVSRPLQAGQALRAIVASIMHWGGVQCVTAAPGRTWYGRVKAQPADFLVAVSSYQGVVLINGYAWNARDGSVQAAAVQRARQVPASAKLVVTQIEGE